MRLKDKVAIITGGTTGIGREIARGYIGEGATVVVADCVEDNVNKMAQELKDMGHKGLSILADVTKKSQVDQMVEKVARKFGKIDILVNCAAIYPAVPFMEITEEEWLKVIDVDLNGVFRCTQAVAKEMLKNGSGRIINITSSQALLGIPLMAHYTAAKGGLVSLTRALAAELSPLGININTISPGLTTTENVLATLPPEYCKAMGERMALRRLGRPDDYVGIAVLLASDEGGYITGVTIPVDGGFSTVMPPMSSGFSEG